MTELLILAGIAQLVLLHLLTRTARRLEREMAEPVQAPGTWPKVGLVVPVSGRHPDMEEALESLLAQDYPDLAAVFVAASNADPAYSLAIRLQGRHPGLRVVAAGAARDCGQKNHNSLAGVACLGGEVDIYAFSDSTHLAQPDFVRNLVAPIARGECSVATGYHAVEPADVSFTTLGYALCVLLMRLLQGLAPFTQPWGGAMAMSRRFFEGQDIRGLWSTTVVDDCSLAAILLQRGYPARLCPGALLRTVARNHDPSVWRAWMDRQVGFLKFCIPDQWRLLGCLAVLLALPMALAVALLVCGLFNVGSAVGSLAACAYVVALTCILSGWRPLLDGGRGRTTPRPLWRLVVAFGMAVAVFACAYARSVRARAILWNGIEYVVGRGGKVLERRP
ncbi:MAG: glycosyltransferase [Desulfovibrio sp.]|jgi:hypothetical protein|nr:glycosyltransferase [Desulfovibrio sp.]